MTNCPSTLINGCVPHPGEFVVVLLFFQCAMFRCFSLDNNDTHTDPKIQHQFTQQIQNWCSKWRLEIFLLANWYHKNRLFLSSDFFREREILKEFALTQQQKKKKQSQKRFLVLYVIVVGVAAVLVVVVFFVILWSMLLLFVIQSAPVQRVSSQASQRKKSKTKQLKCMQ